MEDTDLTCYCSLLEGNIKQVLWHSLTGGDMCMIMHNILVLSLVEGLFRLLIPVSDPEFPLV